jgi:FkbM family methyltransferase
MTIPERIISFKCHGSEMYVDSNDEGLVPSLFKGIHEQPGTKLFQKLVQPGMVFLDIGANVGYYTLMAANLMKGNGRIYSFEPSPANYELLVKNIEVNGYTTVTAVPKAVSNNLGKTEFFLDKINIGGPSLCRDNMPVTAGTIEVETTTLDDFFEREVGDTRIDLIKTDAQGAEGKIFEGAENIIENNQLTVIMEFWPFGLENMGTDPLGLLQRIQSYGFEISTIDEAGHPARCTRLPELITGIKNTGDGRNDILLLLEK